MANQSTRTSVPGGRSGRFGLSSLLVILAVIATVGALLVPIERARSQGRTPAAELDGGTGWLGTDRPLQLKDLRGKIVILDFWTLC
jgi:hypothetical protein